MLCIKNGTIHDAVHREAYVADILVENGKICRIGENLEAEETIDASGLNVYPGFVDAHSHIGLDGYGEPGADYNEMNDICCPQLRAIDGVDPMDHSFELARNAGVTCVCTGPGSANVLGGTFTVIKTAGKRIDDMIVKQAAAMKCAFGENPKRCYNSKCDSTRMTTAAILREALMKAQLYLRKKEAAGDDLSKLPPFDMKLEALIPVLRREIPLKAHAHRADDIFTAIRIAKEFGVRLTLEHGTLHGRRPVARTCDKGRGTQQVLADAGYSEPRRVPCVHYHGLHRYPAAVSSAVRRYGCLRGHGSV